MRRFSFISLIMIALSACANPSVGELEMIPGRITKEREAKDTATCQRLKMHAANQSGFVADVRKDCEIALIQTLDRNTSLAVFDVSRAYLDAMHDYVNALDFTLNQSEKGRNVSDYGAYLIARKTGFTIPMKDWQRENSLSLLSMKDTAGQAQV